MTRARTLSVALLTTAAMALAGCGDSAGAVHAPKFVVPSQSAPAVAGPRGSAEQASTGLRTWMRLLNEPSDAKNGPTLRSVCHGDAGCLALVKRARALPQNTEEYGSRWSVVMSEPMKPDPEHSDSWLQYIRPVWAAGPVKYGGHDGWTTRTMLRCRLKMLGDPHDRRWRMWLIPMSASQIRVEPVSLDNPVVGDL